IGLSHDPDLLHLDTGFTILPDRVLLAAAGMFSRGFLIDENRNLRAVNPIAHAQELGFTIIRCDKADAISHERCNLLPLGRRRCVAFAMPADTTTRREEAASFWLAIATVQESAKREGGGR